MAIEEEGVPWYYDIMKFLKLGAYPDGANKRVRCLIRMMAMQYILCGGQLYRRSYDGIHIHCLKKEEAMRVMDEVHQGVCSPHMNGRMLAKGVKSCHDYQTHANLNHMPPSELYSMTSPWPFLIWDIDVIGKIAHKASNGHEYSLVAINYFTTYVEEAS